MHQTTKAFFYICQLNRLFQTKGASLLSHCCKTCSFFVSNTFCRIFIFLFYCPIRQIRCCATIRNTPCTCEIPHCRKPVRFWQPYFKKRINLFLQLPHDHSYIYEVLLELQQFRLPADNFPILLQLFYQQQLHYHLKYE